MNLDFSQKEEYPLWAAQVLEIDRGYFGKCSTISVVRNNKIVAVAVYSCFNGINCEITVAAISKWWLRKEIVNILLKYPFEQLGCKRVTLMVKESNKHVINLAQKLGFNQEGCLEQMYEDGENCILFGLLKSRWRNH